ncbi:MAG: VPLPA-CTERM sorting domain-containing protein, partial [Pseudomonadota bacterium]
AFIPAGFQPSDDFDGLSFAQGSGLPRTSTIFGSLAVDELAGRDYLDFSGGLWGTGANGEITFGLRDNAAANQPFLLFQRPNEFTSVVPVPAALPLLLSGLGIFGFLARRRNKA